MATWRRSEIKAKLKLALITILVMTLFATLALTGCSGAPKISWAGSIVHEFQAENKEGTLVDYKLLIVGTMEGKIVAYDLADGHNKEWTAKLDDGSILYGAPVAVGKYVYVATYAGKLYKIEADTGDKADSVDLDSTIVGGVAVSADRVYVTTHDGVIYAYTTTEEDMVKDWQYPATGTLDDRIWSTPVFDADSNMVYFGGFDKKMYALDATTGTLAWTFETGGAIGGKPLVDGDNVYFGSFDRKFYAVNKITGEAAWDEPFVAGNWFWTEAIAYDGKIYVGCLDHKVYSLKIADGDEDSSFTTPATITVPPLLVMDGDDPIIVVATSTGVVYGLDADDLDDDEKWDKFTMDGPVQSPMSTYGEHVFVYDIRSNLYALKIHGGGDVWDLSTS